MRCGGDGVNGVVDGMAMMEMWGGVEIELLTNGERIAEMDLRCPMW